MKRLIIIASLVTVAFGVWECKKSSVSDSECKPEFDLVQTDPSKEMTVILIGDQGCGNENARRVASDMNDYAAKNDVAFIVGVGDNVYQNGVSGVNDPKFKSHFEDIFDYAHLDLPFYLVLGNHDYEGSINAQIDYSAKSERWNMPNEYYTFDKVLPTGEKVSFFALDTYELLNNDGNQQVEWLSTKLNNASDAKWKIVFGHHPLYNNGNYGDHHTLIEKLAPLFNKHNVRLYLSGHEHNIQYLKKKDRTNYIITGSSCKLGISECKSNTIYNANQLGFSSLRISNDKIIVESVLIDKGIDYVHILD